MKVLSIVGTRPQLIKLAPITLAFSKTKIDHSYIDTGQHYDFQLSGLQSNNLALPAPIKNLNIGSASHAEQTAKMLIAIDAEITSLSPDLILVYGDTNSTLAASLAASKRNITLMHIEAGLRSFNKSMPEEKNRIVVDHISDYLFAPTENAIVNLKNEGLAHRSVLVGDVMADLLQIELQNSSFSSMQRDPNTKPYYLCTIHRAENTDNKIKLKKILHGISKLQKSVIVPMHPRLRDKINEFSLLLPSNITTILPVSHSEMIELMIKSDGVITDSGGLQKEAYLLEILCSTVRSETEWIETLEDGWNILVENSENLEEFVNRPKPTFQKKAFGMGDASQKIVAFIQNTYEISE